MTTPAITIATRVKELQTLILSFHPLIVFETAEEERVVQLLQGATQEMNLPLLEWSVAQGLSRSSASAENRWNESCAPSASTNAYADSTEPLQVLKLIQEMSTKAVFWLKDFGPHLQNDPAIARQFRELVQQFAKGKSAIVVSGAQVTLPGEIARDAVYIDLKLPTRDELDQVVGEVMRSLRARGRIQIDIQEADRPALVKALSGMTLQQARQILGYAALEDGKLDLADVPRIVNRKAQIIRANGVLEYFPAEEKPLQLGGFNGLKQWLTRSHVGFGAQAQALNLSAPKGILIVGVQGCGKSLCAKTIAQAWKMPLLKLDAGRLYDKYVGESEKNFREAIRVAESMAPAVLWIDEIEKSLGQSGGGGGDGGLSQRLFGSFLTWMQEKSQEVFVIATANDVSQLPPELMRKGRFDEIFFVDLPNAQERAAIVQLHLVQRQQNPAAFDLSQLVTATDGFSGAEIESAVITALYDSLYRQQPLSTETIVAAIKATVPLSVSRREDVEHLREMGRSRFVSVR